MHNVWDFFNSSPKCDRVLYLTTVAWSTTQRFFVFIACRSQGSTAVTSLNRLTSPTTYRPKISYVGAPSYCARTQVSHVRQTDQLSDTACEKVATIKPNDESPLHFDASAATKALATQLVTRLNLTTEQVRLTIERGCLTRVQGEIDSLWCGHRCFALAAWVWRD